MNIVTVTDSWQIHYPNFLYKLLKPGLDWLEQKTGKPVLGVLPYLSDFYLDAEDSVDQRQTELATEALKVVVPRLPRISNHNDFDPLRQHPQVNLQFVPIEQPVPACDLLILPGSKSVRSDLALLYGMHCCIGLGSASYKRNQISSNGVKRRLNDWPMRWKNIWICSC